MLITIISTTTGEIWACNRLKPILKAIERSDQWRGGPRSQAMHFIVESHNERVVAWVRSELDYRFRVQY